MSQALPMIPSQSLCTRVSWFSSRVWSRCLGHADRRPFWLRRRLHLVARLQQMICMHWRLVVGNNARCLRRIDVCRRHALRSSIRRTARPSPARGGGGRFRILRRSLLKACIRGRYRLSRVFYTAVRQSGTVGRAVGRG